MPVPVSINENLISAPTCSATIRTRPPRGVNLIALFNRLPSTC
jgi:hypothetical protein